MQILPNNIHQMTGNIKIAGPAFTGYGEEIPEGSENDSGTRVEMLDHIEPHTVSVWQTNGHEFSAHWGEIMSNAAVQRGCTAAVLDGGVRDLDFILGMKFPVYCRFACSGSSIGRWSIRKYQVPIKIGRTEIKPGDFIFGDIDGVVVVPQDITLEVLLEAEALANREDLMRGTLSQGGTVKEMYEKYGTF
jgi:regulator of RNase E activity RraA